MISVSVQPSMKELFQICRITHNLLSGGLAGFVIPALKNTWVPADRACLGSGRGIFLHCVH